MGILNKPHFPKNSLLSSQFHFLFRSTLLCEAMQSSFSLYILTLYEQNATKLQINFLFFKWKMQIAAHRLRKPLQNQAQTGKLMLHFAAGSGRDSIIAGWTGQI
jgi:hypothetical protein